MKRCPECRRDYFDDTLLYCLDDGTALLEGPASFEPRTEIIPWESQRGETIHTAETRVYASSPSSNLPSSSRTPFIAAALGGVLLLAAVGYGVYRLASGASDPGGSQRSSANMQVQRLTGDGKTRGAVISPDGKLLAYIRTEGSERSIWIKQIATDTALQLAKPGELDRFESLTFSPDGVFLYFNAEPTTEDPPSIYRVSTLGGTPTKVIENALVIKFSPDGKQVSYGRFDISKNEASFFVANPDGSGERKVASRAGTPFFNPDHTWSPDGKLIAAVGGDDTLPPAPGMSIVLIHVSGGAEPVEMAGKRWGTLSEIAWHPSGDSILIAAAETTATQSQIWEVAYPSGEVRRLTNNLNGHNAVSVTADGKAIVTGEIYSRSALWVSPDLKPENAKPIMQASADTWGFGWTPDNRIVFSSDRSGDPEIWIIDADGANARALTNDRVFKQTPVVSPDGRYIVYSSAANGGTLERIDINGGNRTPLTDAKIGADNADISLDGKWVLFSGWTGGQSRIMKVPLSGGESQIVTEYQAMEPRYSRDGTRFACFMPNETTRVWTRLAIVPAEGGPPIKVFDAPPNTSLTRGPVWTPDDRGIVVIINEGEKQNLWLLPVDGTPGKRMTDFEVPGIARREYSRDGKRIAVMRSEGIGNAIMITNFR
jgi:Tol biopolymer transport system component